VRTERDWIGWELFGNRAVRQGDWKLLYLLKAAGGPGEWQLFNLRDDPAELNDLSKKHPDRFKAMLALWGEYMKTNGLILTGDGPFAKGK
jgi:arylsulfatase